MSSDVGLTLSPKLNKARLATGFAGGIWEAVPNHPTPPSGER